MRKRAWWIIGILAVLVAPIAWYLGSPLFISRTVNEAFPTGKAFPMSAGATIPTGMTPQQVEDVMAKAAGVNAPASEAMPKGTLATRVARGTFVGKDGFHKGEGVATVYRVGQELVLRFEEFKVTNGPALYVILTKHAAPKGRSDVEQGHVEIGRLKGNIGNQNYTLPAEVNSNEYRAVVVYCKEFHVVFATASLQATQ